MLTYRKDNRKTTNQVADPGFPRGRGANPPGGRQHTILPNFLKKCMKLKQISIPSGGSRPSSPLRSANVIVAKQHSNSAIRGWE